MQFWYLHPTHTCRPPSPSLRCSSSSPRQSCSPLHGLTCPPPSSPHLPLIMRRQRLAKLNSLLKRLAGVRDTAPSSPPPPLSPPGNSKCGSAPQCVCCTPTPLCPQCASYIPTTIFILGCEHPVRCPPMPSHHCFPLYPPATTPHPLFPQHSSHPAPHSRTVALHLIPSHTPLQVHLTRCRFLNA